MQIGTVKLLGRYPVKSMLGEELDEAQIRTTGVAGDRKLALQDRETMKLVSAKMPRRWGKMLQAKAVTNKDDTHVTLPDGRVLSVNDKSFSGVMSDYLGRAVGLIADKSTDLVLDRANPDAFAEDEQTTASEMPVGMAAPAGTFFDFAPIHIILTSSLARIANISLTGDTDTIRFRPNIVIEDKGLDSFSENGWVGKRVRIGNVLLEIITPTPRCALPTVAHGDLPRDQRLTFELGKMNRVDIPDFGRLACLGAYAAVVEEGSIRLGDNAKLLDQTEP